MIHALTANDPSDRPTPPPGYRWSAIDRTPSTEFPHGFITYHFTDPSEDQTPVAIAPNWAQFRLGMLADPGFRRIVAYGETIDQSSLAAEINQNPPNHPTVAALELLWNSIRAVVPSAYAPTVFEVAAWNAIATNADIPFRFSPEGYLEV